MVSVRVRRNWLELPKGRDSRERTIPKIQVRKERKAALLKAPSNTIALINLFALEAPAIETRFSLRPRLGPGTLTPENPHPNRGVSTLEMPVSSR